MPYNANKVFVEYSEDGVNWISEEQEDISEQVILFFEDFKLRCFRIKVEGGFRDGYSNIVLKPGFVMDGGEGQITPDDEQENEDIDGDRGGGGRDDPDRDDSGLIMDKNNDNKNDDADEQRPEDSDKIIESNDKEKDNKPHQDEKNIKIDKEKNNINNKDNNIKNNTLIIENKFENSLKEKLIYAYSENEKSSKSESNYENLPNREYISNGDKTNKKINLTSKPYNKIQNSHSGVIIGIGIVTLIMIGSMIAVNPSIIKYIRKFIKFK